jgi:hypothetical protein
MDFALESDGMRRWAERSLGFVAWGWVLWTLYQVGRFGGAVLVDPSTTGRIMAVRTDDQVHSAVLLTYQGIGGAVLVVVELLVVSAALALSCSTRHALRRAGLVVLCAWALLWLGNALWMERLMGGMHVVNTSLLAVVVVITMAWAALRWRARAGA